MKNKIILISNCCLASLEGFFILILEKKRRNNPAEKLMAENSVWDKKLK